jgi:hypothetical protein
MSLVEANLTGILGAPVALLRWVRSARPVALEGTVPHAVS